MAISGTDAARFPNKGTVEVNGTTCYLVEVPLYDRYKGDMQDPILFESNCSYMLRVIFSSEGVVMFTPQVYPWFDGETEGPNDEGEFYDEQVIGNAYLFGDLVWSDRNLGAEAFDPSDADGFRKCTGFYYQYDRNIPYFPMQHSNGVFFDRVAGGQDVYPVVSNLQNATWFFRANNEQGQGFSWGNVETPKYDISKFIASVDSIYYADADHMLSYNGWRGGFGTGYWANVETQPVPPGWRLPSQQDFFSILPTTPQSGNITFKRDIGVNANGEAGGAVSGSYFADKTLDVIYVHIPISDEYPNIPSNQTSSSGNQYVNYDAGLNDIPGDPSDGYSSEYVISKVYDNERSKSPNGSWYFGTIYGIKKVGTNDAYRMRWTARKVPDANFYVLDIEKFTASRNDRLSIDENNAQYYYKYDWSRPTAKLTIPMVGMIGDIWSGGKVGNFGSEVILGTSETGPMIGNFKSYKTYRIKLYGTDAINQFIYPAYDRRSVGSQLRLVRESTFQNN